MKKPKTFRPAHLGTLEQSRADYERRRGSARQRGYDSHWDRAAAGFKAVHPLCLGCEAVGLIRVTEVVDHVVPHRGDRALFWDRQNWQPCCAWHHDVVKAHLEARFDSGSLGVEDLRLDSAAAQHATRLMRPTST